MFNLDGLIENSIYNKMSDGYFGYIANGHIDWHHCREEFQSNFKKKVFFFYSYDVDKLLKNIKPFQRDLKNKIKITKTNHKNIVMIKKSNFWNGWRLSLLTAIIKDCNQCSSYSACFSDGKYLRRTKESYNVFVNAVKNKKGLKNKIKKYYTSYSSFSYFDPNQTTTLNCCWNDIMRNKNKKEAEGIMLKNKRRIRNILNYC